MDENPALPADLELIRLGRAGSARDAAVERARAGAPEGTLVWVERPQRPFGRGGREWLLDTTPGLHAALVLRPGLPAAECAQLGPVTAVALGRAISTFVQPMAELHYRWPNDVLLDGGKAAGIWLDASGSPRSIDWLVLAWAVNTASAPERLGFDAAALAREGAAGTIDTGELLQAIARQLVAAISTWDDAGFEPILNSWRGRLPLGGAIHVSTADGATYAGVAESVDAEGALTIRADASTHRVSLTRFFGLPEAQP